MMAQELVTAVQENIKIIVVLVQNHGFASIGALSESVGAQRFGTSYRYRDPGTGRLDGAVLPVDLAANAESLGVQVLRADGVDELRAALLAAKVADGPVLVQVETDPLVPAPDSGSWWDVPVAEVSPLDTTTGGPRRLRAAQGRPAPLPLTTARDRWRRVRDDRPAQARQLPRLVGGLVRRRPAAAALAAVPRRARRGRLRVRSSSVPTAICPPTPPAAGRAGRPRPAGRRRHDARLQRPAPRRRVRRDRRPDPRGRRADRGPGRQPPGLRPGARLPRRRHRRLPRARGADRGRVAHPDEQHRPARPDGRRGVRRAVPVPPARRQPRRDPRAGRPVPRRHRPGLRLPLPGHRAPRLPTSGQRSR